MPPRRIPNLVCAGSKNWPCGCFSPGDRFELWDIQAEEHFSRVPPGYLKNAATIVDVVDGTRPETLKTAVEIKAKIESIRQNPIPSIVLFNKSDLSEQWQIDASKMHVLELSGMLTSAKQGNGVATAFNLIGRLAIGKSALAPG